MDLGNLGTLLGVAIGFSTVMFVLSMIVTAVVQSISTALRIRGRIAELVTLEGLREWMPAADAVKTVDALLKPKAAKEPASHWVLRAAAVPRKEGFSYDEIAFALKAYSAKWADVRATVEKEDIPGDDLPGAVDLSREAYDRIVARMRDAYTMCMRLFSISVGFALAYAFQISSTDLLRTLSIDPEVRARLVDLGADLARDATVQAAAAEGFQERNVRALDVLANDHPDARAALEEMSGATADPDDALAELREVVEGRPDAQALTAAYAELLADDQRAAQTQKAAMDEVLGSASMLDLRLWPRDDYYRDDQGLRFDNLLGVLITGILLTLGAPFWYEKLRALNVLRDATAGRKEREGEGKG